MTGWWFGVCKTANFDWVVLSTRRIIVVCFAIMPFPKDVFLHNAEVNHNWCQVMISGWQYGYSVPQEHALSWRVCVPLRWGVSVEK